MSDYPELIWIAIIWALAIFAHSADLLSETGVLIIAGPSTLVVVASLIREGL